MLLLITVILLVYLALSSANKKLFEPDLAADDGYPTHVPEAKVRTNGNKVRVSHGRLQLLGGPTSQRKVTYKEFNEILQCPTSEPDLDGNRGTISMMRMVPPTRNTVELICAWAETDCSPWHVCHRKVKELKSTRHKIEGGYTGSPFQARLLRVINGKLHYESAYFTKDSNRKNETNCWYKKTFLGNELIID